MAMVAPAPTEPKARRSERTLKPPHQLIYAYVSLVAYRYVQGLANTIASTPPISTTPPIFQLRQASRSPSEGEIHPYDLLQQHHLAKFYQPEIDGKNSPNSKTSTSSTNTITSTHAYNSPQNNIEGNATTGTTTANSGEHFYGYRYYDPETGRWPSRDPIGERGGVNLYAMVRNDLVNEWDYLGLFLKDIIKGIAGNGEICITKECAEKWGWTGETLQSWGYVPDDWEPKFGDDTTPFRPLPSSNDFGPGDEMLCVDADVFSMPGILYKIGNGDRIVITCDDGLDWTYDQWGDGPSPECPKTSYDYYSGPSSDWKFEGLEPYNWLTIIQQDIPWSVPMRPFNEKQRLKKALEDDFVGPPAPETPEP